ncbi:MAG: DNA alkylation repair protein [Phycisphaerae bacterium]|nr:DNA alkylation repair protein [Phycisphaerae bacterium]
MNKAQIIEELTRHGTRANVAGMARFGIRAKKVLGVSAPVMRGLARRIGKDHKLAGQLWRTGIHEARFVASLVDVPADVTERQMESWAADFDNWAVCDSVCGNLFDKMPWAYAKALAWSRRPEEFVKRAGFSLMAWLTVHDKKAPDAKFVPFFRAIKRESTDERNFVRKAVNWALRQIGKSRPGLRMRAIAVAREVRRIDSKSARWIAADALRELTAVGRG